MVIKTPGNDSLTEAVVDDVLVEAPVNDAIEPEPIKAPEPESQVVIGPTELTCQFGDALSGVFTVSGGTPPYEVVGHGPAPIAVTPDGGYAARDLSRGEHVLTVFARDAKGALTVATHVKVTVR